MLTTSRGDNDGSGSVCGRWAAPTGAASTASNVAMRMSWFMVLTPSAPALIGNAQGTYPEAEPARQAGKDEAAQRREPG